MDFSYAADWLNLLFRWLHIIFGAAWIGTSFYFNWLNNHVRPVTTGDQPDTVGGDLWSVHGGHFYRVLKYTVAPEKLPKTLHWFKWEAYLTWITGFCLLVVVYYFSADIYMVDKGILDINPWLSVGIGVATLVVGFVIYHYLCKSPLGERPVPFAIVAFLLAGGAAYGLTEVMPPRAAYIHVGALLGTCMAWNVFFVIIPNQKVMVDAMVKGEEPPAKMGIEAAQRSLHNNYMTLPVLYIMVSNHFPMTFGHELNWAILAALSLIGAGTRHYFNLKGRGQDKQWILPVAAIAMIALAIVSHPTWMAPDAPKVRDEPIQFAEVKVIIDERCVICHAENPVHDGFQAPPKGVMLETADQIKAQLGQINKVAVTSQTMPLGNLTNMTDEERMMLGQWIHEGGVIQE